MRDFIPVGRLARAGNSVGAAFVATTALAVVLTVGGAAAFPDTMLVVPGEEI